MCVEDGTKRTKSTTDKDHRDLRGCQVSWPEAKTGHFGNPCRGTSGQHPGFRSDCLPYTHQYLIIHSVSSSMWHQGAVHCPFWGFGVLCLLPKGGSNHWGCSEVQHPSKIQVQIRAIQSLGWALPATVETLAKRLHCNTPTEKDTIMMPPFFFCRDGQMDTQLGPPAQLPACTH